MHVINPLITKPYISIQNIAVDGTVQNTYTVEPPLIGPPKKSAFSAEFNQAAIAYEIRAGETEGIGNPNDGVPLTGKRLFSWDDKYLLFLGSSTDAPMLYRRTGPTFVRVDTIDLPNAGDYYRAASFSVNGLYLAVVLESDPQTVVVYERDGDVFDLKGTIALAFDIERLSYGQFNLYLAIFGATDYEVEYIDTLTPLPDQPAGVLLAVSPNERNFVIDDGTSLKNYRFFDSVSGWTLHTDFAFQTVSGVSVDFSPDGLVMAIFNPPIVTGNVNAPAFYSRPTDDDPWEFVSGHIDSIEAETGHRGVRWSFDSLKATFLYGTSLVSFVRDYVYSSPAVFNKTVNAGPFLNPAGTHCGTVGTTSCSVVDIATNTTLFTVAKTETEIRYQPMAFSPDGAHCVFIRDPTNSSLSLYIWNGTAYTAGANVGSSTFSYMCLAYSPDGKLFAGAYNNTTGVYSILVYARSGNTYSLESSYTPTFSGGIGANVPTHISFAGPNKMLVGTNGHTLRLYDITESTWTYVDIYASSSANSMTPDAVYVLSAGIVFKWDGTQYNQLVNLLAGYTNFTYSAFSPDGAFLIHTINEAPYFKIFARNGDTFTEVAYPDQYDNTSAKRFSFNADGTVFAMSGGGNRVYDWVEPQGLATYTIANDTTVAANAILDDISHEGDLIHTHVSLPRTGIHYEGFSVVSELPFDPDHAAVEITEVQYSPSGTYALWITPDGIEVAVKKRSSGGYIRTSTLDGTFVSVYKVEGDRLVEKDYVTHDRGTVLRNMLFSATPVFFSYHAEGLGRYVYDVHDDEYGELGIINPAALDGSFLAFSPFETYFVLTRHFSDATLSNIGLFKFAVDLTFSEVDSELVSYGPCDFSSCDDIVVAHGGSPNPITLYKREDDALVFVPPPEDMDWEGHGTILDIEFYKDCSTLLILEPDKITTVIKDEDENLDVEDEAPLEEDEEAGDDTQIEDDEDGIRVNDPTRGNTGGGSNGGGWNVNPGGGLNRITYLPYVSVSLAYWPKTPL